MSDNKLDIQSFLEFTLEKTNQRTISYLKEVDGKRQRKSQNRTCENSTKNVGNRIPRTAENLNLQRTIVPVAPL